MLTDHKTINEYEAIRLFREIMQTDAQKRILCLTGVSKVGKSHLLMNVFPFFARQDYQARYVLIDLSNPFSNVQDVLSQLSVQLGVGGHDFPAYYAAIQELTNHHQIATSEIPPTLSQITVADKHYQGMAYCKARYLTAQFIKDCSQFSDQPILLLFDNVETASHEMQWWLMKILLSSTSRLKHMRVVLAGRSVPAPDDRYLELWRSYQLCPVPYIGEYVLYCQNSHLTPSARTIQILVPELDYLPGFFIDALPRLITRPDNAFVKELVAAKDITEKAATIAEACLSILPEEVASIARICVLFHWFDQTLIEALRQSQPALNAQFNTAQLYERLQALPFIETLPWGLRFQRLTRAGLLQLYQRTQPELLKQAAKDGALAYEPRKDAKKIATEFLFCSIIAGDRDISLQLLHTLQTWAYAWSDWHYLRDLLAVQEEAERFSFVRPLPRNEDNWLLRGLVSHLQGRQEQAISNYSRAIKMNKKNPLTYVRRGTVYAERQQLRKARADYKRALRIAPNLAVAYACRGSVFMQQDAYASALKDFNLALQHNGDDPVLHYRKGIVLHKCGNHQEALAAFDQALRLDPYNAAVYREKGTILKAQGRYQEALAAFDAALDLDPYHADSYQSNALSVLKQHAQISDAYAETVLLVPKVRVEPGEAVVKKKMKSPDS